MTRKIIKKIKSLAKNNKKKRARLCMHLDLKDKTNEMIIALNKKVLLLLIYIRIIKVNLILLLRDQ